MYNWRTGMMIDEDHLPPGNPAGQLIHPLGWCNCLNITSIKKVSVHKNSCSSDRALKSGSKLEFGWRKSLDNKALEWRTLKFVQVPIHYYISVKMHCVIGRSWQSLKGLFLPATHPSLALSTYLACFLLFESISFFQAQKCGLYVKGGSIQWLKIIVLVLCSIS